jgi:NADPH:quinone reductase-like Zn-dependent oxidoreductase
MKANRLQAYGGYDQFKYEDVADLVPGAGQVLVKVAGSSLNPFEVFLRQGYLAAMMPLQLPATLGLDVSGTVHAVGPGVSNLKVGDRVVGMLPLNGAGSNAEFTVAAADGLARVPRSVNLASAAAVPLVGLTGWQAVNGSLKPRKGDRVLVSGALGAVGRTVTFAVKQLGAIPVAGVRAGRNAEAKKLGGDAGSRRSGAGGKV